jgi:hypothetical protein
MKIVANLFFVPSFGIEIHLAAFGIGTLQRAMVELAAFVLPAAILLLVEGCGLAVSLRGALPSAAFFAANCCFRDETSPLAVDWRC